MGDRRACLVCRTPFGADDLFCFKCGAKIDSAVLDEAASIDYLLCEIREWPNWITIPAETEKRLIDHYEDRIVRIIDSIRALPPEPSPAIETIQPPPPVFFAETRPQQTDAVVNLSALEAVIADPVISTPPQITFVEPTPVVETKPIEATPIEVAIAPAVLEEIIAEEPEAPRRTLTEVVAENIKLIFAICASLFVGGILLYYRDQISHGLKLPMTQAIILGLVTLSSIVAGWTLVRRTNQTLAGRTLTLVGSLLVPINPWFLVRTQIIPQSGNGWILGLACAALYGWTAYFLKEKLYVYLALVTGIITGWAAVFQLIGGDQTSAYSVVLMAFSIAYLLAENFVRRIANQNDDANIDFGSPFFHVAQVGIALSLLFYTPLVAFVPAEFVAAKRYFDPNGYSSWNTVWLALCAAFGYFYSGLNRRYRVFVYLGITALLCAESAALYKLEVALPTAVVVYVLTALIMTVISRFGKVSDFYARPLSHVGILAALGMVCWSVALFGLSLDKYHQITPDWRIILSIALGGAILTVESVGRRTSETLFGALFLFSSTIIFSADKLAIPHHLFPIIILVPAYALLILHKRTPDEDRPYPREHFHSLALVLTACIIAGSAYLGDVWLSHQLTLSALALGLAGLFAISARKTIEQNPRIAQSYLVLLFGAFSYGVFLNWTGIPTELKLCLGMIYPFALIFLNARWEQTFAAYFGNVIEDKIILKSSAIVYAAVITALGIASWSFTESKLVNVFLLFELAAFFAISGFNSKDRWNRIIQFYASLLFGALSYATLLNWTGIPAEFKLCLGMIYPFALMFIELRWEQTLGRIVEDRIILRSSAIVSAIAITALGIASGSFTEHALVDVLLFFELAAFFAISGFNSKDHWGRIVQFYISLLFGALSYATFLSWTTMPTNLKLCLGMVYPFALMFFELRWKQTLGRFVEDRIVLRSSAIVSAMVITALGIASWPLTEHKLVDAFLLFELAVFFAVSGFNSKEQFSQIIQSCASILFGALSYATVLYCSNLTFNSSLCLGMFYPFAALGAALLIKDRLTSDSQKLRDTIVTLRVSAIVLASTVVALMLARGSFDADSASSTILLIELGVFYGASGFSTRTSFSRLIQFFTALFFGVSSFGTGLIYLGAPNSIQVPLMVGLAYLMHGAATFFRTKISALSNVEDEQSSRYTFLVDKLEDTRIALTGWAILLTGYGIVYCIAFYSFLGESLGNIVVTAEIAGLLVILGHKDANRIRGYISFLGACLFSAICLNSVLQFTGLTLLMQRPFAFALLALAFYLAGQQNRLRAEFRDSLSIASTVVAGGVFFRSLLMFIDFDVYRNQVPPVLLIAPLLIIAAKEITHLVRTRNILHSAFSVFVGFALLGTMLGIANVEVSTGVIWLEIFSLACLITAHFLTQRRVEEQVVIPIEAIANAAVPICGVIALSSSLPFNLRTCTAVAVAAGFYAVGAIQRKAGIRATIYAHTATAVSILTVTVFLNHFGITGVPGVSSVLIPLLSIYIAAEYLLKRTVFSGALFNVAQVVFPVVAILALHDGLRSQPTWMESSIFFGEISLFYLLSALQKKMSGLIYPGIAAFGATLWFALHGNIRDGYIAAFFALFGFALLLLHRKLSEKQSWSAEAMDNSGHVTLSLAAFGASIQSVMHMHQYNDALTPIIASLVAIIAMTITISITERDSDVRKFYRKGTVILAFITYLTIGIRLGYRLAWETEFYSVPLGALFLVIGYIQARRKRDLATIWLWIGSLLVAVPSLLHALHHRFMIEQSSTSYDVALLVISIALILGGILEHLKAPTIIGGTSFLTIMSVIVFSYVDWEQKTLSISMIVLALILFVSSWIIYSFYKRNQLGSIGRQGKQVIEELGKWR